MIRKLFLLFVIAFLFLAGCSQSDSDNEQGQQNSASENAVPPVLPQPPQNGDTTLPQGDNTAATQTGENEKVVEYCTFSLAIDCGETARLIAPPSYEANSLFYTFTYSLEGAPSATAVTFPQTGAADYDTITAESFTLSTGTYLFVLTAYTDAAASHSVLSKGDKIKLTAATNSLTFDLEYSDGTSGTSGGSSGTGDTGSISVEFSFSSMLDLNTVTAKLIPITDVSLVTDQRNMTVVSADGRQIASYQADSIPAGNYILFVTIKDGCGRTTVIPDMVIVAKGASSIPSSDVSTNGKILVSDSQANLHYDMYVSASGDDETGTGKSLAPFATIAKAIDAIKDCNLPEKDWTVWIDGVVAGNTFISSTTTVVANSLTISGKTGSNHDTLQGDGTSAVFRLTTAGTFTFSKLTISGGSYDMGGGLYVGNADADVTLGTDTIISGNSSSNSSYGGGGLAINNGSVTCDGAVIKGNTAPDGYGGGVYIFKGSFLLKSGTIGGADSGDANTAAYGGGVVVAPNGTFTQTSGTICRNKATVSGGGVYVLGTCNLQNGEICNNTAVSSGGGLYVDSSTIISGGVIKENSAANGAGLTVSPAAVMTIFSGEITDNSATENGAGIFNGGILNMGGGLITRNEATKFGGGIFSEGGSTYIYGTSCIGQAGTEFAGSGVGEHENMAAQGGGIYVKNSSSADGYLYLGLKRNEDGSTETAALNGGVFRNYSSGAGGGIYVMASSTTYKASVEMYSGTIGGNTAVSFGGGIMEAENAVGQLYGGTVIKNKGENGGGIAVKKTTYTPQAYLSGVEISSNEATSGAGLFCKGGSVGVSESSAFSQNLASENGGAVYLESGDFSMGGAASIPCSGTENNNDVYLASGCYITVDDTLSAEAPVATIRPESFTNDVKLLGCAAYSGLVAANFKKFALTDSGSSTIWGINPAGYLAELGEPFPKNLSIMEAGKNYVITSEVHLTAISDLVNNANKLEGIKFVLANDIALTNDWIPIGDKNASGCYFKGTFDGNGRTISGLQITGYEYCGLFGYINGGTVKNLTVEGSVIGTTDCGGIAGMAAYKSVIDNCISKVEVISDGGTSVGGIVGEAISATIQNCINYGNVSGVNTVGGIAGSTSSTKIYNCANFGTIEGNANVGGLCGVCPTEMKNCYNAGTIASQSEAGAGSVCGNSGTSGPFKNVFWFSDTYGKAFSSGATIDGVTEIANTEAAANSLRSDLNNGIIASDVLNSMPGNPYLIWVNNYTLNGITYPTTVPGR